MLVRSSIGLIDYFLPGTKEFVVADWEQSSDPAAIALTSGSNTLRFDCVGDDVWRAYRLATAPDMNGCYIFAEVRNASGLKDGGMGLVADKTTGSIDASFVNHGWNGAGDFYTAPSELANSVLTQYGTQTSNLAGSVTHYLHVWVDPTDATPAVQGRWTGSTLNDPFDVTNQGPLATQRTGKPGGLVHSGGSTADFEYLRWFGMLDRYVRVNGMPTGWIAKVLTTGSPGTVRFSATESSGVALIDLYGDIDPLSNYKVGIYSDASTLIEELHPTDGAGVVWGGDVFTYTRPSSNPAIVNRPLIYTSPRRLI